MHDVDVELGVVYPNSVNARRWAGSSSIRRHHRSLWLPPDRAAIYVGRTITDYSNAEHVMGYATAEQIQMSASYYSQGRPFSYELEAQTSCRRSQERSELQCRTPIAELSSESTEVLKLPITSTEEHAATTSQSNSPVDHNTAHYQYNSDLSYSAVKSKGNEREPRYEGRYNMNAVDRRPEHPYCLTIEVPTLPQRPVEDHHEISQRLETLNRRDTEEFEEWHDSEEWLTEDAQSDVR
jgi:hypothetical protein